MLRIFLFLATNLAVLLLASLILMVLGVSPNTLPGLWIYGACLGFGGAFLSLALSKMIAKWTLGLKMIDPNVLTDPQSAWLMSVVKRQAEKLDIGMPEVAIWNTNELNAFATGARRNNALVAVSSGLLSHLNKQEVEAVIAHEMSHVANGDMVTMSLLQGVLNTFVVVLSRLAADRLSGVARIAVIIGVQIGLGMVATMIVMWFSRRREFRADAGAAVLVGPQPMISALRALHRDTEPTHLPSALAAFGVRAGEIQGWRRFFMSHPNVEDRILALEGSKVLV